ncbi:MAG: PEP/pyruvate-binding domain-containing protein, partial [Candidatus Omnitrophota bacterium]|nr:PEP/pyruvate-binding domain-containing protein [Candidatus Omnitrophota bacterium]
RRKENAKRSARKKNILFFSQGQADGDVRFMATLGMKGANLAEMAKMRLPIPPGFTITTKITSKLSGAKELPMDIRKDIKRYIKRIERRVDYRFGDKEKPLLLSIRGGSRYSMPGLLGTITNVGLNDETVEGLANLSGNRQFAYNSYIRFILDYANQALNVKKPLLLNVIQQELSKAGARNIEEASPDVLISLVKILKLNIKNMTGQEIPDDSYEQLVNSIMAVAKSWDKPKAVKYRERNSIPHDIRTAVNVQMMVFGNLNNNSGTGVAFTRNPLNGEREVFGEVLFNSQGKDIVSGKTTPLSLEELDKRMPLIAKELRGYLEILEKRYKEIQDVEFTIQDGKLYILQTRGNENKVTPLARAKILMDLTQEGIISEEEALKRISLSGLLWFKKYLESPALNPKIKKEVLATGIPASPGIADGKICFDEETVIDLSQKNESAILVLNESFLQDEKSVKASSGTLTRLGGATSHAAIIARGSEIMKPVITGASGIQFIENGFRIGDIFMKKGDFIILDGNSGKVYKGRLEKSDLVDSEVTRVLKGFLSESKSRMFSYYKKLNSWIDIKKRDEDNLAFIRNAESSRADISLVKNKAYKALLEARSIMAERPTQWRKDVNMVTRDLLEIKYEDHENGLTYEEVVLAWRYIYKEDARILARILHTQASKHNEISNAFDVCRNLTNDEFDIVLFNLMGSFNAGDFTRDEYDDFLRESYFPIVRLLANFKDYDIERYIENSSKETLASIIEESVRFDKPKAGDICKVIAEKIYNSKEIRDFLLGAEGVHGRLTPMAFEWFNGIMDETVEERLKEEKDRVGEIFKLNAILRAIRDSQAVTQISN